MATSYQILGQVALSSSSESLLYAVPDVAGSAAVASSLTVCNLSASDLTFRVRVGAAASADTQWLFYDSTLFARSTITMTLGLTLGRNERVYVSSATATGSLKIALNLFGSVIT